MRRMRCTEAINRGTSDYKPPAPEQHPTAQSERRSDVAGFLGGASAGGLLSGGLGELLESFKQSGHGETAESWVGTGPNKPVTPPQLEQAIGPDVLETLSKQTGLSREELLERTSRRSR